MRFGVIIFPGSNCDYDAFHAILDVLGEDAEYIWHTTTTLKDFDCVIIPGGFSYGDYLRAGAIAHIAPVMKPIIEFANRGGLIIGICNGFQILLEVGLLPGAMLPNSHLKFVCKQVNLKVTAKTPFTSRCQIDEVLSIPIAHGQGNYYADVETLRSLQDNDQIVFQYADSRGEISPEANPNGSVFNIAGICNQNRNVLGMMPHPERAVEMLLGTEDGRKIFKSLVAHLSN